MNDLPGFFRWLASLAEAHAYLSAFFFLITLGLGYSSAILIWWLRRKAENNLRAHMACMENLYKDSIAAMKAQHVQTISTLEKQLETKDKTIRSLIQKVGTK